MATRLPRRALVLFAHGARDPQWATPFHRLRQIIQTQLPDTVVELAFLELMTPKLPELTAQLQQCGCDEITVVPVFLGQGGHVSRDLPLIVAQLQQDYPAMAFRVAAAAGEDADVLAAIAQYCIGSLVKN
ncbi:sirohydrochlorin chelatase [Undibacterium arcticum]|uniref:Sirohydrochlorin chelatase n=1 Tax=Undibacterium arcticum TaxID=1762892 RepID=A0ABV7F257_9BURK